VLQKALYSLLVLLPPVLTEAQQPSLVLPIGHSGIVRSARFSDDGKYVITGGADQVMKIWQTHSGKMIQSFNGSKGEIYDAFFSADTKYAAVITDSAVYLWSVTKGQLIKAFDGFYEALFSSDNKRLLLRSLNGSVTQVWVNDGIIERTYIDSLTSPVRINREIKTMAISDNGRRLVTAGAGRLSFFDILTGTFEGKVQVEGIITHCFFIQGNRYLIVISDKSKKKIDLESNYTISDFADGEPVNKIWLSPNRKFLLTSNGWGPYDLQVKFWNTESGKDITGSINWSSKYDTSYVTDQDGSTRVVVGSLDMPFPRRVLAMGTSAAISEDGNFIYLRDFIWNHTNPALSDTLPIANYNTLRITTFSPDSRYLLLQDKEGEILLWDTDKQNAQGYFNTKTEILKSAKISPDGSKMVITGNDNSAKIITLSTGKTESVLKGHLAPVTDAAFSADGKRIITNSLDSSACLWNAESGELLHTYKGHHPDCNPAYFNSNKLVLPPANYDSVPVYDEIDPEKIVRYVKLIQVYEYRGQLENSESKSGRYTLKRLLDGRYALADKERKYNAEFSFDNSMFNTFSGNEKWLAFANNVTDTLLVWDIVNKQFAFQGKLGIIPRNRTGSAGLSFIRFSPDGKYLLAVDVNELVHWKSTIDFKTISRQPGSHVSFDTAGKYYTLINKGTCELYDYKNKKLLYSYISVDKENYLVADKGNRYDGTTTARQLLYYSCGSEVIDLQQFKDQLWVPNLAERIMKGDSINAKTLSELNICGLTPEVEDKSTNDQYRFEIKPRLGGLGETVLYINGIEARRYKPAQLIKMANGYELQINKKELSAYFIAGKENPVTVKAYTADNSTSSRGIIINEDKSGEKETIRPNLYAVMVGVSDYKGDVLDLKYAAKDATDFSRVLGASAKKLLNTDGKEHVFLYNLTTADSRYQLPEKQSIRKVLEEIGSKATANDILLIFFAGHGAMAVPATGGEEGKSQFYFLTADASPATAAASLQEVGISTAELAEWLKPQYMKAQKRILVFDACNSGQAIRDFVKLGNNNQGYIAARNDEQSRQVKAIDKLNEQSGFFILSASASNQNAYEMGRYSQGLLTYALLKAIRQQPDILDQGRYLDVSRWFSAAEKTVTEITKENGARQQPQVISNTNFNIGIVDEEIIAGIILPEEKPVFTASIFINSDEAVGDDDLELSMMINRKLADISSRGTDGNIIYMTGSSLPDTWSLTGRYELKGTTITVKVNLKQQKEIKHRFEITGTKNKIAELAAAIVTKASSFVQ
jgi:WD40 repeat protein/uncharacterized caspase-like protein